MKAIKPMSVNHSYHNKVSILVSSFLCFACGPRTPDAPIQRQRTPATQSITPPAPKPKVEIARYGGREWKPASVDRMKRFLEERGEDNVVRAVPKLPSAIASTLEGQLRSRDLAQLSFLSLLLEYPRGREAPSLRDFDEILENTAVEQQFAVAVDAETYAADVAVDFIVDSDVSGKAPARIFQIDVHQAGGMSADAFIEGAAGDCQRLALDGFVLLRRTPAGRHLFQIHG